MCKVFVYGSLKEGFGNYPYHLSNAVKLGTFFTAPEYTMYSLGGFPAVCLGGDTSIYGEVFRVTEEEMEGLDRLEGFPSFYNRKLINTPWGKAWMYYIEELTGDHDKVCDGVWREG